MRRPKQPFAEAIKQFAATTDPEGIELFAALMDPYVRNIASVAAREMLARGDEEEKVNQAVVKMMRAVALPRLPRCAKCGKPFAGRKPGALYCSDACASAKSMQKTRGAKPSRSAAAKQRETRRRISEDAVAWFREHILTCPRCREGQPEKMCAQGRKRYEAVASDVSGTSTAETIGSTRDYRDAMSEDDDPTTL